MRQSPYFQFNDSGIYTTQPVLVDDTITLDEILTNVVTNVLQTVTPVNNCACLVGTPYIENGVCKCNTDIEPTAPIKTTPTAPTTPTTPTTPTAPTTPTTPTTQTNIIEKLKENPLLALAGAGVLAYLIFKK